MIACSNEIEASGTVEALTAVLVCLHGDHFWPVKGPTHPLPHGCLIKLRFRSSGVQRRPKGGREEL